MDFRSLEIFITLANVLNFRQTSQMHYLTPSGLSRIIQRMEDYLGCPLFIRDNKHVELTKEGKELYQFAKRNLAELEALKQKLNPQSPATLEGEINIETTVTISYQTLPSFLKQFSAKYPKVMINITAGSPERSMEHLLERKADFILQPVWGRPEPGTDVKPISESALVLIGPKESPEPKKLADLEKLPMILTKYPALLKVVEELFEKAGVSPKVKSYMDGNEAILAMVASGAGYAILPQKTIQYSHLKDDITIAKNFNQFPVVKGGIFRKKLKYYSPAQTAMWKFVDEYVSGKDLLE